MVESRTFSARLSRGIVYAIVILMGLLCLLPILNILALSLSSGTAIAGNRVGLIPVDLHFGAYQHMIEDEQLWRSFGISTQRTFLSLIINMFMITTMAYPLSKSKRQFRSRNIYMRFMVFAMLFSGGLIPTYLVVNRLGLVNTIWSLVLPGAVPIFSVILVMNFFANIPKSLEEAAVIDGANPIQVLVRIYVPLSKAALATVALFSIVWNWNDFFGGLVYMTRIENYPLMTYIQTLTFSIRDLLNAGISIADIQHFVAVSDRNLNAAKIFLAAIPLLIIYPFLQKYFVTGIVVGAVKE